MSCCGPGIVGTRRVRRSVILAVSVAALALTAACIGDPALAQGMHGGHSGGAAPHDPEYTGAVEHGITLAATAFLAGLGPFAALVWLPASRRIGVGREAVGPFGLLAWALLFVLATAGVSELAAYATRASGEPLGTGLFWQALFDTRVGAVWLARLGFGLLTAAAIAAAVRSGWYWLWWAATGAGGLLLMTLTQLSHAAATGRFLPFLADWTHAMAAAVWMGGLLGFAVVLFAGPLDAVPAERRAKLREHSVRRFSTVATIAVAFLAATGLYASLLHVPSPRALFETPYGIALTIKLGLLALVLAVGGANFLLRGRGPFGWLVVAELLVAIGVFAATGFLTSLPPADAVWRVVPTNGDGVGELHLEPADGSGIESTATFEEVADGVQVRLEVSDPTEPDAAYSASVYRVTCSSAGLDADTPGGPCRLCKWVGKGRAKAPPSCWVPTSTSSSPAAGTSASTPLTERESRRPWRAATLATPKKRRASCRSSRVLGGF